MENRPKQTVQEWLPFERILKNGVIQLKNKSYIKIRIIVSVNFIVSFYFS